MSYNYNLIGSLEFQLGWCANTRNPKLPARVQRGEYVTQHNYAVDHPWQGFMIFQCCQYMSMKLCLPQYM